MNFNEIIKDIKNRNRIFCSEADLIVTIVESIKKLHGKKVDVLINYSPNSDSEIHIDIVVIYKNKWWYPIEVKYKTKELDDGYVHLKTHGAHPDNIKRYNNDISRIIKLNDRKKLDDKYEYGKGYIVFLTNDNYYWNNDLSSIKDKKWEEFCNIDKDNGIFKYIIEEK